LTLTITQYKVFFMITWNEELVAKARVLLDSERHLMESLTAIRKKRGITQAEVARRMGVSQPAVAAFEHYDANPRMASIRRYALAIGAEFTVEVRETGGDSNYGSQPLPVPRNTQS
jgi:transcriptional regulator with XRE-family HTH domain